ncbi:amino acid adenylation domain-containing protein [Amycolatopsis sp. NPDC051758]|uniref:amino acid adenylation domain-containing protein n=1 Tax=Amycolatopsis sp. NPDC051758 TaxID=3363935 RepID=UPI00378AC601
MPATVIEQIADRADAAPEALALDCRGTRVSYGELMARVDALAATLAVCPGQRVAVCAPRGIEALTGILAVLRARGAFVPIDVTLPEARIAHQLEDSGAVAVLATPGHAPATGVPVLPLDAAGSGPVCSFPEPRDLAYVMYTSGSTGKPKGVEVEHTGLTNYVGWAARTLPRAGAGSILHSPLSFDFSFTSLFVPLVRGESITLLPEGAGFDELLSAMERPHGFVRLTPTHLRLLLPAAKGRRLRSAAYVIGGEALPPDLLRSWAEVAPDSLLYNHYGPTEGVVGRCVFAITAARARRWPDTPVPIGRPIDGTEIRLLDEAGAPVADGATGEIWLGGTGIARGYLGRPDLTAERFTGGGYRTGDAGRLLPSGDLVFAGRLDDQVKIRGYRVEPAEIEIALAGHPAVAQAVVTAEPDPAGDLRLVATVVPAGPPPSVAELREHLSRTLPSYFVPAVIRTATALPAGRNGKLDRRALAAPAFEGTHGERLAGIWRFLLELDEVTEEDNFFDLGGTSLLAVRVAELAAETGIPLTPTAVIRQQTLGALTAYCEGLISAAGTTIPAR